MTSTPPPQTPPIRLHTPNPARESTRTRAPTVLIPPSALPASAKTPDTPPPLPARRPPSRSFLKRFDWMRLMYAMVIAALLWGYVDYRRMMEVSVDVPVRFTLPSDWKEVDGRGGARVPRGDSGDTRWVRVTLAGAHRVMSTELRPDALVVTPKLSLDDVSSDSTEMVLTLNESNIAALPHGVTVTRFYPPAMSIQLTRLVTHSLPVELVTTGTPEAGFVDSRQYKLDPATAEIRIPKTLKEKLTPADTIKTAPFDLTGRRTIASGRVALAPFAKDGYEAAPTPGSVWVTLSLDVKPERREVAEVPLFLLLSPSPLGQAFADFRFAPTKVTVTIEGPPGTLDRLDQHAVVAFADAQEALSLGNGAYSLRCRAIAPEGGKVVKIEPPVVRWAPGGPARR